MYSIKLTLLSKDDAIRLAHQKLTLALRAFHTHSNKLTLLSRRIRLALLPRSIRLALLPCSIRLTLLSCRHPHGWGPLHEACANGHTAAVRVLLNAKADANLKDDCGRLPLHLACANGTPDMIELLLKKGANVNGRDVNGCTPIHYCVKVAQVSPTDIWSKHRVDETSYMDSLIVRKLLISIAGASLDAHLCTTASQVRVCILRSDL